MTDVNKEGGVGVIQVLQLIFTIMRATVMALNVIYPGFKAYKALETRSLKDSQAMLLYLCVTTFINALKEVANALLGTYSNFVVWKLIGFALNCMPLLIGPDRMYNLFIEPLFQATRDQMESLGEEMSRLQDIAKQALPAVKQGDVVGVVAKTSEIAEVVAADSVHLAADVAGQLTESLQEGVMQIERIWWKHGLLGALERMVHRIEAARERTQTVLMQRWQARGPVRASDKDRLPPPPPPSDAPEAKKTSQSQPKDDKAASSATAEQAAEKGEQERKVSSPSSSEPDAAAFAPTSSSALRRRRSHSRRDDLVDDSARRSPHSHSAEEKRPGSSRDMLGAPPKPVTPVPSAADPDSSVDTGATASSTSSKGTESGPALDRWRKYVKAAISQAHASDPQMRTKSDDSGAEERKQAETR